MPIPKPEHDSIAGRLSEIRVEHDVIPAAPNQEQDRRVAELDRETTALLCKLAEKGTAATQPEPSENHLACPRCKSTELDFTGLDDKARTTETLGTAEPDIKIVSATYKWKCRDCAHEFVVSIHN